MMVRKLEDAAENDFLIACSGCNHTEDRNCGVNIMPTPSLDMAQFDGVRLGLVNTQTKMAMDLLLLRKCNGY